MRRSRLPKVEKDLLIYTFCNALVKLKDVKEAAQFLKDLLSSAEIEMLALRLQIARLLEEGYGYDEIGALLMVAPDTIARVKGWLDVSGEGYRKILKRTSVPARDPEKHTESEWEHFKETHPLYFWPQLLIKHYSKERDKRKSIIGLIRKGGFKKDMLLGSLKEEYRKNYSKIK